MWIASERYLGDVFATAMMAATVIAALILVVWLRLASNREAKAIVDLQGSKI